MKQSMLGSVLLLLIPSTEACMRVTPTTPGMPAVQCKACAADAVHVKAVGETGTARPMTSDMIVRTGACAERTFICAGKDAGIELFVDHASVGTVMTPKDRVSITATCNAAGTAWVYMNRVLSDVECAYTAAATDKCKLCTYEQIKHLMRPGKGAKEFTEDKIFLTGACATRTFKCDSPMAVIEVFGPNMEAIGEVPGKPPGETAVFNVTCNADGTGWVEKGKTITAVECADAFAPPMP